jgi:hypothetical protein
MSLDGKIDAKKFSPFNRNVNSSSTQRSMFILDLKMSALPKEVSLPNTAFEKYFKITNEMISAEKIKFSATGGILNYISAKNHFDTITKDGQQLINEKSKKTI